MGLLSSDHVGATADIAAFGGDNPNFRHYHPHSSLRVPHALYRRPEQLTHRLPTLRLLTRPVAEIEALAKRVAPALPHSSPSGPIAQRHRNCRSRIALRHATGVRTSA